MNKLASTIVLLTAFLSSIEAQCAQNAVASGSNCLCSQGYYGSNANTGGVCNQCPTGSTTATPSTTSGGNTNAASNISVCNQCQSNYYMTTASNTTSGSLAAAVCQICLSNSGNSGVTSVGDASQCTLCLPNYYMTAVATNGNAAVCQSCPSGSGNTGVSTNGNQSQCNNCQLSFYMTATANTNTGTAATCQACPTGSTTSSSSTSPGDSSQCSICQYNAYMTVAAVATQGSTPGVSAQCSFCPSLSYSSATTTIGSITSCICFDSNAIPLSLSANYCTCKNGYGGSVATSKGALTGCVACTIGQFSIGGSACIVCATGSTISSDHGSCICNDTSNGTVSWSPTLNVCQCKANYYGDPSTATAGVTGSCTPCPDAQVSQPGTTSVSGCLSNLITYSQITQVKFAIILISTFYLFFV